MKQRSERSGRQKAPRGGRLLPALCSILGTVLLLAVIVTYLPLTVPGWLGYEAFHVESPSMEPEIPTGSVIYVLSAEPVKVEEGEVIAFRSGGSVIVHRVVQNRVVEGTFLTKGDANASPDPEPATYAALIGTVRFHLPLIGGLLAVYATTAGKIYALLIAASGLLLHLIAGRLRRRGYEAYRSAVASRLLQGEAEGQTADAEDGGTQPMSEKRLKKPRRWLAVLIVGLLLVFVGSGLAIWFLEGRYRTARSLYEKAAARYTAVRADEPMAEQDEARTGAADAADAEKPQTLPPITVDFAALRTENPDIVGWIYCAGTPIDYPILYSGDDETYLRHSYDGAACYAGSIFVEGDNSPDFSDDNTILYGHNMRDGSMFHSLTEWKDQAFYEGHPVIWLLTPTQDYRIELISGHTTDARSDCYTRSLPTETLRRGYWEDMLAASDFATTVETTPEASLVLLSTCAYDAREARRVLHGLLVPVGSAGGQSIH